MHVDINSHARNALVGRMLGAINLPGCKAGISEAVIAAADVIGCVCAISFTSRGGRKRLCNQSKTAGRFVLTSAQTKLIATAWFAGKNPGIKI
jgi:hypothetical protein